MFTVSDIVVAVGPQLYGRPVDQLERSIEAVLTSPECIPVKGIVGTRERHWTTASVVATEVAIAELVDEGIGRRGMTPVDARVIASVLRTSPVALTAGQRRAVEAICADGRGITVILGMAGTGKTTAVAAAADVLRETGHRVIGTATSGQAARTLGLDAGVDSHTLASLRWQLEHGQVRLGRSDVVVVDEAGMTDDPDLLWVLGATQAARAKVALIGDDRQLGPVGPGGGFGAVLARHHRHVVTLDENLRQTDPGEADALADLRHGRVARAVDWYAVNDRIRTHPDADTAIEATVNEWLTDRLTGADTGLYAWRRSTIAALNAEARHQWEQAGRLTGPEHEAPGGRRYRAGDQVIALAPAPGRLVTSERATVARVDPGRGAMSLQVSDGSVIELSREETEADRLDHGYAVTVHRAQGATVDHAHYLNDGGARELAYVGMSRARSHTTVHAVADDYVQAREDLTAAWLVSRQPRWAIDQAVPDNDSHLAAIASAAGRAQQHAKLAVEPDHDRRELSRQLTEIGNDQVDLKAGRGRWADTPAGQAARALHAAEQRASDAYHRVHEPGIGRTERRSRERELKGRTETLAAARGEYKILVDPELDQLAATKDRLREQLDQLAVDAMHERLQQRFTEHALERAVPEPPGLDLGL